MKTGKKHTILLLDMDGVLLTSEGYYRSLQDVIKLIGQNLGISNPDLKRDVISKLEAFGLTHIWEHLAIFSSLLLIHVWSKIPDVRIPDHIDPVPDKFLEIGDIDFNKFIQRLSQNEIYSFTTIKEALIMQQTDLSASQIEYIQHLFETIKDIYKSPILTVMQEFVLGSQQFSQVYELPSHLTIQSYPRRYDQAVLSKEHFLLLKDWLKSNYHHVVIFTNRPDVPPEDFFGVPEAELGAEIVGLPDVPLVGAGSLDWLAQINNQEDRFYKPHPIHALAAMQAAVGQPIKESMQLALDLFKDGQSKIDDWKILSGARLFAVEDSKGGLESVKDACQLLGEYGIQIELHLIGVSTQEDKIKSLHEITDQVYADINHSPLPDFISSTF